MLWSRSDEMLASASHSQSVKILDSTLEKTLCHGSASDESKADILCLFSFKFLGIGISISFENRESLYKI